VELARALSPSGAAVEGVGSGVRHVVVGDYVTFYRVDADAVEILRVLHGRRNIERDEIGG